jgi:hypothetical protein
MYHAPSRAVSRARDWARSEDAAIRISDSGREWWPKVEKRHRRWRERERWWQSMGDGWGSARWRQGRRHCVECQMSTGGSGGAPMSN